jgi:lipoprotein NlpD
VKWAMLLICLSACACQSHPPAPVMNAWLEPREKDAEYIVRSGDTIYSIAWQFGLNYVVLANENHLKPPYKIYSGQRLKMTTVARGTEPLLAPQSPVSARTTWGSQGGESRIFPLHSEQSAVSMRRIETEKPHPLPAAGRAVWQWPAAGKIVDQYDPRLGGNLGANISGKLGSPVKAALSGEVVYSGNGIRGYGNLIIIKHNQHYLSAYAYNQALLVKNGQKVRTGQTIGAMGEDEAGQVRLHFEIRYDGRPVDPLKLISHYY